MNTSPVHSGPLQQGQVQQGLPVQDQASGAFRDVAASRTRQNVDKPAYTQAGKQAREAIDAIERQKRPEGVDGAAPMPPQNG